MTGGNYKSWPEIKDPKYLSLGSMVTTKTWLEGKHIQDGAENLWRIHDKLYDLNEWMEKHPGGKDFIELSKGTDITELFEAHHISTTAENMLPKFYVKEASTPRNSPYSFHSDGFYQVLKRRLRKELPSVPRGIKLKSMLINDLTIATAFAFLILGSLLRSPTIGLLASVPLCFGVIASHNYFHQNSWRRFYFDLSLMSHREWRVSHVMSHHIYTNTEMDLEIAMFKPFFQYLPNPNKNLVARYLAWLYSPLIYGFTFFGQGITRYATSGFSSHDLVGLIIPLVILIVTSWDFVFAITLWIKVIFAASWIFTFIGLTAAHHHPDLFHEGDVPRKDRDWGLNQLDAVVDRTEISGNLVMTLFTFGTHSMHHLFPAVDHAVLDYLHPTFEKTCAEFNFDYSTISYADLICGQFRQLARNTTRVFPMKKSEKIL